VTAQTVLNAFSRFIIPDCIVVAVVLAYFVVPHSAIIIVLCCLYKFLANFTQWLTFLPFLFLIGCYSDSCKIFLRSYYYFLRACNWQKLCVNL